MKPKQLKSREDRQMARYVRDRQWRFMRRCAEHDPLWFSPWNKHSLPEAADEWRDGLLGGMEIGDLIYGKHANWFAVGRWSTKRAARPVRLTDAGKRALRNWRRYDAEPVAGGLVEPGWTCVPARSTEVARK